MAELFVHLVLPIIVIVAAGYAFRRTQAVDVMALAKFSSQLLSPFLIFAYLARSPLDGAHARDLTLALLLYTFGMMIVTIALFRLFRRPAYTRAALMTTLFPNTGNYGLPLVLFAYGEDGFQLAIFVVVLNFILMYSVGIFLAAGHRTTPLAAFQMMLRLPTTHATILGLIFGMLAIPIPDALYQPIKLVGDAMIPVALLILGMQLAEARLTANTAETALATVIRLGLSPLVMAAVVLMLGIHGLAAKVLIVQNATSAAVIMTMLAAEYEVSADYVAAVTLISTLLSFFSLSAVLYAVELVF